ncbi:MAG TPA: hypothetical protein ENI70_00545, partial [Candidatus Peregrinibacteria bacterium]|nr:hypothetical protein [Candidatus Peregrinibacteria bacterium]
MTELRTTTLLLILLALFLARTFRGSLLFTYLWQLKEYRLDRMMDLMSTRKGRGFFFNLFLFLQIILLLSLFFWKKDEVFLFRFLYLVGVIYLAETLQAVDEALRGKLKRPKWTKKALLIGGATLLIELALLVFGGGLKLPLAGVSLVRIGLMMLFLSLFLGDINAFIVMLINPVTQRFKNKIIARAKKKMKGFKDLRVIGIT